MIHSTTLFPVACLSAVVTYDGDLPTARATSESEMGSRHMRSMKWSASATTPGWRFAAGATLAVRVTSASTNARRLF